MEMQDHTIKFLTVLVIARAQSASHGKFGLMQRRRRALVPRFCCAYPVDIFRL
jgi:hypothetical protein